MCCCCKECRPKCCSKEKWLVSNVSNRTKKFLESRDPKDMISIALAHDEHGVVIIDKYGKYKHACGISEPAKKTLDKILKDKREISSLSLGSYNRFFISCVDGGCFWKGNETLSRQIKEDDVKMIAFGSSNETFVVLYEDGDTAWSAIPKCLSRVLSCNIKPEIINMGPRNEFFVRFSNGSVAIGNLEASVKHAIDTIRGSIDEVIFGYNDSVIVRYHT